MKKTAPFLIAIFLLVSLTACENIMSGNKISEGKIVYEIEYLDDEKENPLISLLPKTMEIQFKENNTATNIEGFLGTFKMRLISDFEAEKNHAVLRIMDKKYIQTVDFGDIPAGYELEDFTIENTDEKAEIAGYKCKVALVKVEGKDPIKLYYTDAINIKNPNAGNPFHEIEGVLLGFQVKLTGLNMRFRAKKVVAQEVSPDQFIIPEGYEEVSKEKLEGILLSFQE